jgi:hypothetical protein
MTPKMNAMKRGKTVPSHSTVNLIASEDGLTLFAVLRKCHAGRWHDEIKDVTPLIEAAFLVPKKPKKRGNNGT